ncbi:hypothetical protein ABH926_000781 [Catenulispora sp. GP43]|uniref:GOLPH3/VPS74 family protein n=1 Tax=Catenulispora sp. GP43 TaxID=3156263 RepID=UPI003518D292
METLGEDLLLLAIKPDGRLGSTSLQYALAGSELVRLASRRRVDVVKDRIVVLDPRPTGDPNLDVALSGIAAKSRPPGAKAWVGAPRRGIIKIYQEQAEARGVVRADRRPGFLGLGTVTRWAVADVGRLADVRSRLDTIAYSAGPVDSAQAALGGLVYAAGLHKVLYPGRAGKAAQDRLKTVARKKGDTAPIRSAVEGAIRASTDSAVHAATDAATAAAIQASVDAATAAAIQASVDAAVSASIDASASHSGHSSGGGAGHH